MKDGKVTIINIFELFKQKALIGAEKLALTVSDDCG